MIYLLAWILTRIKSKIWKILDFASLIFVVFSLYFSSHFLSLHDRKKRICELKETYMFNKPNSKNIRLRSKKSRAPKKYFKIKRRSPSFLFANPQKKNAFFNHNIFCSSFFLGIANFLSRFFFWIGNYSKRLFFFTSYLYETTKIAFDKI